MMIMMTNLSWLCACAILSSSQAFQIRHAHGRPPRLSKHLPSATTPTKADQHLQELALEWDHLSAELKEFVQSPVPSEVIAGTLTTHFLTTALDHAHTQEQVEEAHIQQVHAEYEHALQHKDALLLAVPLPVDDPHHWMVPHGVMPRQSSNKTADAEAFLQQLVSEDDPYQRQQYFHVASSSHPVYDYWQRQCKAVHQEETMAKMEEEEARRTLEEMQHQEQVLKETLAEFQALLKQQQLSKDKVGQLQEAQQEAALVETEEGESGQSNGESS